MTAPLLTSLEQAGKDWIVGNHRIWLARQLLDARLSDEEAYRTVAYSPAISDTLPTPAPMEAVAWRYPVLTARDEAVARMARAMRNGKAWPAVFQANTAEALAEDALAALEALAVIPTEGGGRD